MALDVFHLGAVSVWFGGLAVLGGTPASRPPARGPSRRHSKHCRVVLGLRLRRGHRRRGHRRRAVVAPGRKFLRPFQHRVRNDPAGEDRAGGDPHHAGSREPPHRPGDLDGAAGQAEQPVASALASAVARHGRNDDRRCHAGGVLEHPRATGRRSGHHGSPRPCEEECGSRQRGETDAASQALRVG